LEDCVAINSDCPYGLPSQLGPVLNFAYWIFLPEGWKHLLGGHFGLATVWRVSIGRPQSRVVEAISGVPVYKFVLKVISNTEEENIN